MHDPGSVWAISIILIGMVLAASTSIVWLIDYLARRVPRRRPRV